MQAPGNGNDSVTPGGIGGRIKQLRQKLGKNQHEFARQVGMSQPSLSQIENGSIQPSLDTVSRIKQLFGTTFEYLFEGILPLDGNIPTISPTARPADDNRLIAPRSGLVRSRTQTPIPLIDQSALAGLAAGFKDPEVVEDSPYLMLPGFSNAIAVHVMGSSMEPTIRPNDILVCTPTERDALLDNYIYVVVTREGALVKRVLNRGNTEGVLVLKSDNKEYKNQRLQLTEILQMFMVRRRITADFSGPEGLYERINQLEQALYDLREGLEQMQNRYLPS